MGGKPSRSTPADRRLRANRDLPPRQSAPTQTSVPTPPKPRTGYAAADALGMVTPVDPGSPEVAQPLVRGRRGPLQ